MEKKKLRAILYTRILLMPVVLGLTLFLPAGTLRFWEAWVYIGLLFFVMAGAVIVFLKKNPEVMERRMRTKEKETVQKKFVVGVGLLFIAGFLTVGFDRRWGWSFVPAALVVLADVMVVIGYAVFILVMRENRFLSRTVEVDPDQKVITTGPYAVVRHPMYVGVTVLYLFTPIALGSYWALIPFTLTAAMFPVRILNEEKVLLRDLAGYKDYTEKTRYRLIPGIW